MCTFKDRIHQITKQSKNIIVMKMLQSVLRIICCSLLSAPKQFIPSLCVYICFLLLFCWLVGWFLFSLLLVAIKGAREGGSVRAYNTCFFLVILVKMLVV